MFPDIAYLSWIEGRPDAVAHDLASSDLRPATRPPEPVPARLEDRPDPPTDVSLEALVAETYGVALEEVLITAGATNANLLAFAVAAEPAAENETAATRDERDRRTRARVLVEKPGYEPMVATPRAFGATVDRFRRPDGVLEPERVETAVGDDTRLVAVTDRHNPTGVRADRDALHATADVAAASDAPLLVDEVYAPFALEATDGPFGGPTMAGTENVVVTGSLTKFLGLSDLRIGWLVADPEFVDAAERVQRHLSRRAAPSTQLARRALHHRDALGDDRRARVRRNHELLRSFVDDRPQLSGTVPAGSTYALLDHDSLDGDELAAIALEEDVLVVPGRFFDRSDGVRVSLGRPTADARAALDALGIVLDAQ